MEIRQAVTLQDFIAYKQQRTLGAPPDVVSHPTATLLQSYVEEGIPANIGPPWLRVALDEAINNGPHASVCAPGMVIFIRGEMQRQVQDIFSILLSTDDNAQVFGEKLKISCILEVHRDQRCPCLILNLSSEPDKETPSVNDTTDSEISPESMQFNIAFPHILREIWDADPEEGPVRVSKLDVTDTYHRGTLQPSQVGAFAHDILSVIDDDVIIICIDMVLPMGCVESPKFFWYFSETLTDVANALVNADLPVPAYGDISALPDIDLGPPHTP